MGISYRKLVAILDEKGITSYTIKKDNVVGQSAWKKIHEGGNIDMRTVEALCKYLHCQPGELLEYVEDYGSPVHLGTEGGEADGQ